jgi:hypothetical protein
VLNREEGEMEISKTHRQASGKTPKTSPRQCGQGYIKSPWLRATGEEVFEKSPRTSPRKVADSATFRKSERRAKGSEREWIEG